MRRYFLSWLVTLPVPSSAVILDKDPLDYSLRQYGAVLAVALIGGLVSWVAKVRSGQLQSYHLLHLVGELATSAFAGLLMFFFCEWAGAPKLLTICLVGIFGHMGTRGIALLEDWAERRMKRLVDARNTDRGGL